MNNKVSLFANDVNAPVKVELHDDGQYSISARELHSFLEVESRFNDWINNRIKQYCFLEGSNFTKILVKLPQKGRPESEYLLTIGMAKELAMVENNRKGKEARQYFIRCEEKLKEVQSLLLQVQEQQITSLQTGLEKLNQRVTDKMDLVQGNFDRLVEHLAEMHEEKQSLETQVETLENEVEKLKLILDFKTLACVYVMFCPHRKLYKIGSTGSTKKREKEFQTVIRALEMIYQIPTLSRREAYKLETQLKERFTGKCREGEWYELDEADLAYLCDLMYGSIEHLRTAKNL